MLIGHDNNRVEQSFTVKARYIFGTGKLLTNYNRLKAVKEFITWIQFNKDVVTQLVSDSKD